MQAHAEGLENGTTRLTAREPLRCCTGSPWICPGKVESFLVREEDLHGKAAATIRGNFRTRPFVWSRRAGAQGARFPKIWGLDYPRSDAGSTAAEIGRWSIRQGRAEGMPNCPPALFGSGAVRSIQAGAGARRRPVFFQAAQPAMECPDGRLRAVLHSKLPENRLHVNLHRIVHDADPVGDDLVRRTGKHMA